jgi:transcriptional regulator with XRE-family HTH domain
MNIELKMLIIKSGYKQTQVARALSWTDSKVSDLVNERRLPTEEDIELLAGVLKMTPGKLMRVCGWRIGT